MSDVKEGAGEPDTFRSWGSSLLASPAMKACPANTLPAPLDLSKLSTRAGTRSCS